MLFYFHFCCCPNLIVSHHELVTYFLVELIFDVSRMTTAMKEMELGKLLTSNKMLKIVWKTHFAICLFFLKEKYINSLIDP